MLAVAVYVIVISGDYKMLSVFFFFIQLISIWIIRTLVYYKQFVYWKIFSKIRLVQSFYLLFLMCIENFENFFLIMTFTFYIFLLVLATVNNAYILL